MTFLEALRSGRPMRRKWSLGAPPWLFIGDLGCLTEINHPWLRLDTGRQVTLASFDYLADDWEVMP